MNRNRVVIWMLILIGLVVIHGVVMRSQSKPVATVANRMGDVVTARANYMCGSSEEALDKMTEWASRGDREEMARVLLRTGSAIWRQGQQAKILDAGGFRSGLGVEGRRVRILQTGMECFADPQAFQ